MWEWVLRLGQAGKEDVPLVGGKGASLSEMVRAGLPVPPGFVVTTKAYRTFVETHALEADIERLVGGARPEEHSSVEAASATIRGLFEQKDIPQDIRHSIAEAYISLGDGPIAVRSSATAEDLPETSFAGQQESYLNVEGVEAVLDAVRRCWSSLWTARAISYRAREGILPADVSIAVVVQSLVKADISGILFTANPVNGRRDQMVVDAAWGLGEAVVGGQVTPDHWVLDRSTGAVVEVEPGNKTVMTALAEGGTTLKPVNPDVRERFVLDGDDLVALANLGETAEAHFGLPQDIEWAKEGGKLYLLQSRPITALFPRPAPKPTLKAGLRVYVCANFLQGFPEPFTPAGLGMFRFFARGVADTPFRQKLPPTTAPNAFKSAAGRIYVDITPAFKHPRTRAIVLTVPSIIDRPMAGIFRLLIDREPSLSPSEPPFRLRPPAGLVLRLASRILVTVLAPAVGRRMAKASVEGLIHSSEQRASRLKSVEDRLEYLEREGERFPMLLQYMLPIIAPAMACRFIAEAKLKEWLGDSSGLQPVLRSLLYNPTTEMDLDLWRVSRKLKAEGSAPTAGHPAVEGFLARYGHRGIREIDIGMPRWRDDPSPILEILNTYLSQGEESDPEAQFQHGAEEADRAASDLVAQVRQKKGILRAVVLRFLLSRVRALLGMREYPKFMAVKMLALYRQVVGDAGAELVESGRLDRIEDVFLLSLPDIASDKDLRELAEHNRMDYQQELKRRAVPRVMTSTGEVFYGVPEAREGALIGTPASPGVYEGTVRVIRDPRGAQLERGEVLVAPGTDPAWTPLFLTAGALVMEIGGIMSHGSVVAREYGIPAVVGVAGATEHLKTGQRVRVDGESGQVLPLEA